MSFIIAAPSSGSGKTTVTLGLLRALRNAGHQVRAAKSGPDYIDPKFHEAACGQPCINLDAWAMSPKRLAALATGPVPLIIEGAMGLFDGAPPDGRGATADLARFLKLPVLLVIDAGRMAGSVAAIAQGFARFDPDVNIAGILLNNVGSARHEAMLRRALGDTPVFGAIYRTKALAHPGRHLGLVQASERDDLEGFLETAAGLVKDQCDLDGLAKMLRPLQPTDEYTPPPPPAQTIAIAQDTAFGFCYPHLLQDWQNRGATLHLFSPLANEAAPKADLIYLPGGYPELYAGQLAANARFMASLRETTARIYGECGGYMTLGQTLIDAEGIAHQMAGLLNLETSFQTRKLHLGYRDLTADQGPFAGRWAGHEFHYATTLRADGPTLFKATDAEGVTLPEMGLIQNNVSGSFAHIIDQRPHDPRTP